MEEIELLEEESAKLHEQGNETNETRIMSFMMTNTQTSPRNCQSRGISPINNASRNYSGGTQVRNENETEIWTRIEADAQDSRRRHGELKFQ